MLRLTRAINLTIDAADGRVTQGWGGQISLGRVPVRLWVTLEGPPAPATGFLVNVADIKAAFQEALKQQRLKAQNPADLFDWARQVVRQRFAPLKLIRLKLELNEQLTLTSRPEDYDMVQVTKKYELAAAHKLWNDDWDQQHNFEVFGKCSNPRGHGHNYTVEITIRGKPDRKTGRLADLQEMDQLVRQNILDRFDHKNFNEDTVEFAHLIPTVENMAKVFYELLDGKFEKAQLTRVAVWETADTYAEYFGPQAGPLRFSSSV